MKRLKRLLNISLPVSLSICLPIWVILISFYWNAVIRPINNSFVPDLKLADPSKMPAAIQQLMYRYALGLRQSYFSAPLRFQEHEKVGKWDSLNIQISAQSLGKLNSSLPSSGKSWQPALVTYKSKTYKARVRYRGFSYWHWQLDHKSWRIQLEDGQRLFGRSQIDVVRPKSKVPFIEPITNDFAEKVGVLASRSRPVPLFVNDRLSGVSFFLETLDREFLDSRGLQDGDIVGIEQEIPTTYFRGRHISQAWIKPNYWLRIHQTSSSTLLNQKLQALADLVNHPSPQDIKNSLGAIIDLDKFANFYAFANIFGLMHSSAMTAVRFYLNPVTERFEPLTWDHVFWFHYPSLQLVENPLVNLWRQDPELELMVQQRIWQLLHGPLKLQKLEQKVDRLIADSSLAIQSDSNRVTALYSWQNCYLVNPYLVLPYSLEEYFQSAKDGKRILALRQDYLKTYLKTAEVDARRDGDALVLTVQPNVAVDLKGLVFLDSLGRPIRLQKDQLPRRLFPKVTYPPRATYTGVYSNFVGLGPATIESRSYRVALPPSAKSASLTYENLVTAGVSQKTISF